MDGMSQTHVAEEFVDQLLSLGIILSKKIAYVRVAALGLGWQVILFVLGCLLYVLAIALSL